MPTTRTLNLADARRLAISCQHLNDRFLKPDTAYIKTGKAVTRAIESLGALIGANTIDYGDVRASWGR